jgi:hypothetical protein
MNANQSVTAVLGLCQAKKNPRGKWCQYKPNWRANSVPTCVMCLRSCLCCYYITSITPLLARSEPVQPQARNATWPNCEPTLRCRIAVWVSPLAAKIWSKNQRHPTFGTPWGICSLCYQRGVLTKQEVKTNQNGATLQMGFIPRLDATLQNNTHTQLRSGWFCQ